VLGIQNDATNKHNKHNKHR